MQIDNVLIDEDRVRVLIDDIQKKKELSEVNKDFIRDQLFNFLIQNRKSLRYLAKIKISSRSDDYKIIIKKVRSQLRRFHGLFTEQEMIKKRDSLFKEFVEEESWLKSRSVVKLLLETHASTKERLKPYDKLYEKIFKITGKPRSILDLGAGLNPLSIIFMGLLSNSSNVKNFSYYCYDINEKEVELLNYFFNKLSGHFSNFEGKADVFDLLHWDQIQEMDVVDVCFLFKVTDILDQGKGHKITEEVIFHTPSKFVVISFPTKTMSGKRMNYPRRKWVELMCKRLSYNFKLVQFENELFYVIEK